MFDPLAIAITTSFLSLCVFFIEKLLMNINFSLRFAEMHTNAQLMLTSVFNTTCYQIYKLVMTEMMALILVFKFL